MRDAQPTPFAGLNAVLDKLVTSVQAILGDNFLGAYLQGSFALGDRPDPWLRVHRPADPALVAETQAFNAYALRRGETFAG